jgi:catechol 2,3-dioxygenase-like lactoylglutathione lyase family enzyme
MRSVILSLALVIATAAVPVSAGELKANRIILRVTDLNTSIAFYRDRIGLRLQSTFDEFAVFGDEGVTVMLQGIARKSNAPNGGLAAFTEVVFESPDVMKTYAEMKSRGVKFTREPFPATIDGARVLYAANFRDPDGHILSLTGWVSR